MPYKISETKDGFNVVNTETGKVKNSKPYVKRDDALKYHRALSAAESQTTKADAYKVPEAVRNNARKVLAWREKYGDEVNGMTEVGWRRARQLADNAEIGLDTVKRMAQFARHRKNSEVAPEYKDEPWKDAGYVAWLGWGGTSGIEWAGEISGREKEHTLKELFFGLLDFFGLRKKDKLTEEDNSFSVFKDDSGTYRWVLISSNAYRDRDGEIVSQKALQDDVDRADAEKDYGELDWWHVDGMEIGDCDFNMLHGKMLVESGTFYDQRVAEAVAEKADELEASIAFRHPANEPDVNGVFHNIRRFKRSLVPKGRASNWLTSLAVSKGENMSTLAEKISAFKALLKDDELANHILQQAETKEKEADAAGLAFKETTSATPDPSTLKAEVETETEPESADPEQARMAAIVEKCMAPYMEKMGGMVEEMKAMYSQKDDTAAQLEQERQTTLKAYGEKLATIENQQAALAKTQLETIATLKEAQKEVKILMGDLPKGVGAFIASTAKETEVDEEDERLKAAPSQDPNVNTDFMSFILPNANFAAQGQR